MSQTGLVSDPLFTLHDPGPGHPESPDRLRAVTRLLERETIAARTRAVAARVATAEEICRVHAPEHYQRVRATAGHSTSLDPDTSTSPESFQAAERAAGGLIALTEAVVSGACANGFALVRPPGHHAERARAMGFCLFNNVAIAAEHARQALSLERVLVVDWDLHHGNGTQHSFYDRREVLYFSTHQYPHYPGTGALEEVGRGPGVGYTVNVPLPAGMGDREFRAIFRQVLAPIAHKYQPQLVLCSAGFDIYERDPLGGMRVTPEGFGALTEELMAIAQDCCAGKLVLTLEGGYHLEGLARGVLCCINALTGDWHAPPLDEDPGRARQIIAMVREIQSQFWKL